MRQKPDGLRHGVLFFLDQGYVREELTDRMTWLRLGTGDQGMGSVSWTSSNGKVDAQEAAS